MNRQISRITAVLAAALITAGCIIRGDVQYHPQVAEAKTLEEIEAEKKEKQDEIDAKKAELEALAKDISRNEQYQQTLQEEIDLINGKMLLIDTQLRNVNTEIDEKQANIADLEVAIAEQEEAVSEGLENFKQRIRTLYVHGNDSLLSALVGATDFYDALAKIDLINRVAKHDDKMCKTLKKQLQALNESRQELTTQVQALTIKQTEMEALRKEFNDSRSELNSAMAETDVVILDLNHQHADAETDLEEYQQYMSDLDAEADAIIQEILRKEAEEQRKKKEEEQKRAAQEEQARIQSSIAASLAATTTTTARTTTASKTTATSAAVTTAASNGNSSTVTTAASTAQTTAPTTAATTPVVTTTAGTTAPPSYTGGSMVWPAPGYYYITSPFAMRWGSMHNGIDISGAGIHYANACAAAAGTVSRTRTGCTHDYSGFCGCNGGCGNCVYINHGNGLITIYMHLASVSVSEGQQVSAGTVIGKIGATGNSIGNSGGYHLHFAVTVNGTYVNPMNYLS